MNNIKILDDSYHHYFMGEPTVTRIAEGFQFTEGPLWYKDKWLFNDVPANTIYEVVAGSECAVWLQQAGMDNNGDREDLSNMIGCNAMVLNSNGEIFICQNGNHAIAMVSNNKEVETIAGSFGEKRFNSPNDLALHSDGSIYFTDPPYGLKDQVLNPQLYQPHAGIYHYRYGKVELISKSLNYPNGICIADDESFMLVSTNHPDETAILKFTPGHDGVFSQQQLFAIENADGIKLGAFNNLFCATMDGVLILNADGRRLALIPLPEMTTNIAFEGNNKNSMLVTTEHTVYHIFFDAA